MNARPRMPTAAPPIAPVAAPRARNSRRRNASAGSLSARSTIMAAWCCVLPVAVQAAEPIRIYVLTGQSNSLGTTADPREPDVRPDAKPSDALTNFWWDNVSSQNAAYPIAQSYGDSGASWTSLQPQQGDGGLNSLFWGPEVGFARSLADWGRQDIWIIKASRGGGGNSFWSKAAYQTNPSSGHMYQHVLDTVRAAVAPLASAGREFEIAGLLYLQGESDSDDDANRADQRLADLVSNLRSDLPHAERLYAVVGGIGAAGARRDVVRAKQSAAAMADDRIEYFTNLDLVDALYDGLHFDKEAKLEIGRRFAERVLQAEGVLPLVDEIGYAAVAGDDDAIGLAFVDYVPDPDGAAPGNHLSESGTFRGFVEGRHGQPTAGVLVDASDAVVQFGDRSTTTPSSSLIVGNVPLPNPAPRALGGPGGPDGKALRFSLVDPHDPSRPAAASAVAFELGFVEPSDQLIATFLAVDGSVLHRTGPLGNGRYGFASLERRGGARRANIHQVVLSGPSGAAWIVGLADAEPFDFAVSGFSVLPEPSSAGVAVALVAVGSCVRDRRRSMRRRASP